MEQPDFASYVPSSFSSIMDLSSSHQTISCASNGSTTSDSREHLFDESSYFTNVPQEILNVPISRVAKRSLNPWLTELPEIASSELSRLSTSSSHGIATLLSNDFYSSLYPEQLHLPAYELIEQPQSLQTCFTSYPYWTDDTDNWQLNYSEGDVWGSQPFVAQPWISNSYDSHAPSSMTPSPAYQIDDSISSFKYASQDQFPASESVQRKPAAGNRDSLRGEDSSEEENSSDGESDWSEDTSSPKPRSKPRSPRMQVDRWTVAVNGIQQSDTRGYVCDVPGCVTAFVRPEHLRRHVKSKHSANRPYACKVPECRTPFSRGDNLRDHYWTHLHRGGRAGKNKKMTLPELKLILGPKEKKLIRRLKEKQKQHVEKEKQKTQRATRPAYPEHPLS